MEESTNFESKTTIAPDVLLTIARLSTQSIPGVSRLWQLPSENFQRLIKRKHVTDGVSVELIDDVVHVDLYVVLKSDSNVREISRNIQRDVTRAISEMVGMQVGRVNVHIEDIDYPDETEA